jgi:hypothetical protein
MARLEQREVEGAVRYHDRYVKHGDAWLFDDMSFSAHFSVPSAVGWAGDDLHWPHPPMADTFASLAAAT